ncbi:MAG: two-component sensor histidine kinase [Rhodomicrobium sp.]|nr:MAG: two-component sensor histidine kinase [Rhodomicrobium sp.]
MNQLTITEFLLRALWRLKQSWHYLLAIAFTQILLFLYTDLTLKWALIAFGLLVACFALLNNPLEDQRPTTMSKSQSGKKKKGDRLQPFIELIEALPDPILLLDRQNKLIAANHQARTNFEITNTGQDISAIIRTPDLLEAVSRTVSSHESERVLIQTRIPVERQYMVNLVWLANGEVRGPSLLIHFRDLSEQERLNRMRSDFIANASHELRTPLASLLGFIDTLQGPARNDEDARDKFLGVMAKQGKRMTRLIDDLLSLSRVEMNVHQHPSDRLDVTGLITHTIDILKPLAEGQGVSLEWQSPEKPVETIGDRDELSQVFQNLIQNAIKYGREGGYVKISLRDVNDGSTLRPRFAIDIEDNGIGIQSHHIPRLTERFYRVDVEQSREKGGTGLGLAIVKHILTHHRGELKIQSKPGTGSTFTIFLPKA